MDWDGGLRIARYLNNITNKLEGTAFYVRISEYITMITFKDGISNKDKSGRHMLAQYYKYTMNNCPLK